MFIRQCILQEIGFRIYSIKKVKAFFCPTLPDIRKSIAFWKGSMFRLFFLLVRATCWWRWVWSNGGMILTGEKRSTQEKSVSQCHFVHHKSHTNWPEIETGPRRWQAGDWQSEPLNSIWHTRDTGLRVRTAQWTRRFQMDHKMLKLNRNLCYKKYHDIIGKYLDLNLK